MRATCWNSWPCMCVCLYGAGGWDCLESIYMLVLHLCHMHYWAKVMAKTWTKFISEKTWSSIILLKLCLLKVFRQQKHACIHSCMHAQTHKHTHAHLQACKYTCTCMHTVQAHSSNQKQHVNTCTYTHKHCQYMQTSMQKPKHAHIDKNIHACKHTLTHHLLYFSITFRIGTQTVLVHIT